MAASKSTPRNRYYLVFSDEHPSDSCVAVYRSKADAVEAFADVAADLARFGQRVEASIHLAPNRASIDEYPGFVLSLGPRGGVRAERA